MVVLVILILMMKILSVYNWILILGHNEEMNENHDDECDSDSTKFSDASDDSYDSLGDEYSAFYNEVYDSVSRGIEEHSIAENIILEINSSKHAYNVPVNEVNSLVIKAVLNLALNSDGNFSSTVKSNLKYGLPIIQNYIKSISSQNDCIYSIEEFQLQNKELVTSLHLIKIIKFLYEENVLEEDLILKWFYKPKSLSDHVTSEQETLRKSKEVGLFIKWLEEAEEESTDDQDD
ncbi:DnaJ sub C member 3, variant 4 [Dermatophagoides farinae]|uniref:DnaJ sub C member 3, variant 2 n=1 Tax=Dermatophagoides farinae TaxID=6954 RepID=A0A922IE15_DERFA|nr:DnaJ sub C member 3, variant 2 [Dermatophagoides farinae]KAH9529785.1 DnaJ sub C member 3, variant 3 [Dermatophagoides farinae]KAH9529786.1 DnaJ sub C member 3, variant 4 [Dermatophagoides farinae]